MVRIGIIGIGFMGMAHYEGAKKLKGAKVTAISTRDPKKLSGDWSSIEGNFGPRGGQVDLSKVKQYSDYHELLADPDIDLVDICLPTAMHEKVAMDSIQAGKHTLVEKPIAIDLKAANRMVKAAEKAGVQFMVAQVLPFFPEFQFAVECVRSQKYGKLLAAHFRRVMAPPKWSENIEDFQKLGGWGIDLHIHDNHLISLMCGVPQKVTSRGIENKGYINHVHTVYDYEDPNLAISCVSGGIATRGLEFAHGFELYFEEATVLFGAGTMGVGKNKEWVVSQPLTLITKSGQLKHPKLKGGNEWCAAFTLELQAAVNAIQSGEEPEALSGALARDALKICYAEAKSIQTGRSIPVK